ncbi:MAG: hypothetical protein ACN6PP_00440 [Delftia tsuruhatensis]
MADGMTLRDQPAEPGWYAVVVDYGRPLPCRQALDWVMKMCPED